MESPFSPTVILRSMVAPLMRVAAAAAAGMLRRPLFEAHGDPVP